MSAVVASGAAALAEVDEDGMFRRISGASCPC